MVRSIDYFKKENELLINTESEFFNLIFGSGKYSAKDIDLIVKAYKIAEKLHSGTKRRNGDPYITHPMNVAALLVRFGFDAPTIIAAILHDCPEDEGYPLFEIERKFGPEVAFLVDGVTKMKDAVFNSKEEIMVATHKKILVYMKKDLRVVAIKLADRTHNQLTSDDMPLENKLRKAKENQEVLIPLARTAGIYIIKDLLQDISLFHSDVQKFLKVNDIRENLKYKYTWPFINFELEMKKELEKAGIFSKFSPKIKNIGAISEELDSGKTLEEIHDLAAIRIILDNVEYCSTTLERAGEIATYVPETYKDYITTPKYNGYRSLNQNIIYSDMNIQLRIRDDEMNRANRLGMVGNWNESSQEIFLNHARELMNLDDTEPAEQFVKTVREKFFHKQGD